MTPLTRPGPCPYCDATNPNAEACIGVRLSALHGPGEHKLLCTELREAWDAGQAAASADAEALRVEIARLKAQTACAREWGSQLYEARAEIARLKAQLAPLSKCQEAACDYVAGMGPCDARDDEADPYCSDDECWYCNLASSLDGNQAPRRTA